MGQRVVRSVVALVTVALPMSLLAGPAAASDTPPAPPAPAILLPIDVASAYSPAPRPELVQRKVQGLVDSLGQAGAVVIDPSTGTVLLDSDSDRPLIPASTMKLATATAALDVLGSSTRIATKVKSKGDTIYLVGGGDPTLIDRDGGNPLSGGSASLDDLARSTSAVLGKGASVTLVYDASAFRGPVLGPGWPASFPAAGVVAPVTALVINSGHVGPGSLARVSDPPQQAGNEFARLLREQGVKVTSVAAGVTPQDAGDVAQVLSPPVGDIVRRFLTDSENNYAEAIAHLVGAKALGEPTFKGGARATEDALRKRGLQVADAVIVDGSGLSSRNRIAPRLLADVLVIAARGDNPDFAGIIPGLAVAGLTGTLADRFQTKATKAGRGVVRGKTGTLTGTVALAGLVLDRDQQVLVFAIIENGLASIPGERDTMDRIASRLATCGCTGETKGN